MNELQPLASAAGMTVGLAVCAPDPRADSGDAVRRMGIVPLESGQLARHRLGDRAARPAGNPGGAVYLFRLVAAAADALRRLYPQPRSVPAADSAGDRQFRSQPVPVRGDRSGPALFRLRFADAARRAQSGASGAVGIRPGAGARQGGDLLSPDHAADVAPRPARPRQPVAGVAERHRAGVADQRERSDAANQEHRHPHPGAFYLVCDRRGHLPAGDAVQPIRHQTH